MRLLVTLIVALAALVIGAGPAGACSCVGGDPRDRLSTARAAFVGTVTEARADSSGTRTYRLTVDKTFKAIFRSGSRSPRTGSRRAASTYTSVSASACSCAGRAGPTRSACAT
jgi:hypothetical protein